MPSRFQPVPQPRSQKQAPLARVPLARPKPRRASRQSALRHRRRLRHRPPSQSCRQSASTSLVRLSLSEIRVDCGLSVSTFFSLPTMCHTDLSTPRFVDTPVVHHPVCSVSRLLHYCFSYHYCSSVPDCVADILPPSAYGARPSSAAPAPILPPTYPHRHIPFDALSTYQAGAFCARVF